MACRHVISFCCRDRSTGGLASFGFATGFRALRKYFVVRGFAVLCSISVRRDRDAVNWRDGTAHWAHLGRIHLRRHSCAGGCFFTQSQHARGRYHFGLARKTRMEAARNPPTTPRLLNYYTLAGGYRDAASYRFEVAEAATNSKHYKLAASPFHRPLQLLRIPREARRSASWLRDFEVCDPA